MQLNFLSQIHLAKLIMPHFVAANGGHFVVISSVSGKMGVPISSSYSASKFSRHGYFDALRAEVKDQICKRLQGCLSIVFADICACMRQTSALHNISVTMVCPGPVYSEIVEHAHTASLSEKHDARYVLRDEIQPCWNIVDLCSNLYHSPCVGHIAERTWRDRKSTRLNSSH